MGRTITVSPYASANAAFGYGLVRGAEYELVDTFWQNGEGWATIRRPGCRPFEVPDVYLEGVYDTDCEVCGAPGETAHHASPGDPTTVAWSCSDPTHELAVESRRRFGVLLEIG